MNIALLNLLVVFRGPREYNHEMLKINLKFEYSMASFPGHVEHTQQTKQCYEG